MIVLAGADIVLPDRVVEGGSLLMANGRIDAIEPRVIDGPAGATRVDCAGHVIVPGFVDVHVHGIEGIDALDGADAVGEMARRLPKYGVTAFCPTSVACDPVVLERMLSSVTAVRQQLPPASARVLPAHLESNFINPDWKGAQPLRCLRPPGRTRVTDGEFSGQAILDVIAAARASVGIITIAPELPGGLDLVRSLASGGHRVSIGHSGATYEETKAAIAAGVTHATHLFNRMSSMTSRAPGAAGAVLESEAVCAEVICDGYHVHPALVALAVRLKSPRGIMAITDGTAGAGLPLGARARLGEHSIVVRQRAAELEDGTLAGSILTMDGAFRALVNSGLPLTAVAQMCASSPAAALRLGDTGQIAPGLSADLVVLDGDYRVRQTYIAGRPAVEH